MQSPAHQTASHILIRPMRAGDIEQVMAIAASLSQAPQWARSAYEKTIDPNAIPRRVALVAENRRTGSLAGFAIASLVAGQAELESIGVAKPEQQHGIGTDLLSMLIDHMKFLRAGEFILEVRSSNHNALALYRRLGWIQTGRRTRYYADPEEDAVLMGLELA